MNRPEKEARSCDASTGKPTSPGLPVLLRKRVDSYASKHDMTSDQVLAEGAKLLLKRERKTRPKSKPRPANKPFDVEERQYLRSLSAVDECSEKRIIWNKYFIHYVESELELGSRPVDLFRSAGVGPEVIGCKRIERCVARWREKARREKEKEKEQ